MRFEVTETVRRIFHLTINLGPTHVGNLVPKRDLTRYYKGIRTACATGQPLDRGRTGRFGTTW